MPIPLPATGAVPHTGINAPAADPSILAAPARALGHLASTIAGVSDHFYERGLELQKIENARQIAEARNNLQKAYAQHQIDLQSDMDPASRMEKTKAFLGTMQNAFVPGNAPPAVNDALKGHFEEFATQATIHQAKDSYNLEIRRAKLATENELETAVTAGRLDLAEKAIATAGAWATPEEQEKIRRNVQGKIAFNTTLQSIDQDPIAAEKLLATPEFAAQNPNLDPADIRRLQSHAEQAANKARADFLDQAVIEGWELDEQNLPALHEAGMISMDQYARVVAHNRTAAAGREPSFDAATYESAWTAVAQYDPAKDPTGATLAQLRSGIATTPLPKESRATLNSILTDRANPEKPPKSAHEAEFARKISTDFSRGDFGKYRFPVDHDKDPSTAPQFPINRAAYDAAWKLRGEFADAWRATTAAMPPDAKFPEVQAAYDTLKKSFEKRRPLPTITPPAAPALPFNPDRTLNPTGGAFGGQPVMAPGAFYKAATGTVFGGANDPNDNGQSAFGGRTGPGGREGVALPKDILDTIFPGTTKAWRAENVAAVIRKPDGGIMVSPLADYGTAESVWHKEGAPTIDLTATPAKQAGGKIIERGGKLHGLHGLDGNLEFAIVSTATSRPLKGLTWQDAQNAWWDVNAAVSTDAAMTSLEALRHKWAQANS